MQNIISLFGEKVLGGEALTQARPVSWARRKGRRRYSILFTGPIKYGINLKGRPLIFVPLSTPNPAAVPKIVPFVPNPPGIPQRPRIILC